MKSNYSMIFQRIIDSPQCGNFTNFPPFQNFSVKLNLENLLNLPLENGNFYGMQYVSKDTL